MTTATAPPEADLDLDAELADFLGGGRPCEVPVPLDHQCVLVDIPGLREPWRDCGLPAVVAHLLRPTDGCVRDRWLYVCGEHDHGDWQCFRHHQPVVVVTSYRIGGAS